MEVKVSVVFSLFGRGGGREKEGEGERGEWIEINRSERREFGRNLSENFGYHC